MHTLIVHRSGTVFLCAALLLGLLTTGCAVGPDYDRPRSHVADLYKEGGQPSEEGDWQEAEPGEVDQGPWWRVFADATLDALMPQLDAANPDIATAEANLRQARAVAREATASFFPTITGTGGESRGQQGGGRAVTNTYRAQLSTAWEMDVFGGIRRGAESAEASAVAAEAQLAAMRLAMRAELAQNYFQLRSYDEQVALYARTIAAYERSLLITRNQFAAGTVTRLDMAQAETQLKNARVQYIALDLQRRQTEHAIAVLLGVPPALLTLRVADLDAHVPRINPGLPSTLLERRPDIAVAERRMAAANAKIGVAVSAFFPVFSLTGSGGYNASSFSQWFTLPGRVWSLGSSVAVNIFQGGALLARRDQAVAAWDAAVSQYRAAVLVAFREVEDQLAATALLEQQEAMQLEALASARDAENLALNQYRGGIVTYLTVVNAQTTALTTARAAAVLKGRRLIAAVALIRSLGGGWSTAELTSARPPEPAQPATPATETAP